MSPLLPDGEPAPLDGALPAAARAGVGTRPFGVYVHVPFCASRCGYCDFNTYVPGEGVARDGFVDAVLAEWALAGRVLGGVPAAATVLTLLPDLGYHLSQREVGINIGAWSALALALLGGSWLLWHHTRAAMGRAGA